MNLTKRLTQWIFPAPEGPKPAPKMTELEGWILEDLLKHPEAWALRDFGKGLVRADSRGLAFMLQISHAEHGSHQFTPAFARSAYQIARARLDRAAEDAVKKSSKVALDRLTDTFGRK